METNRVELRCDIRLQPIKDKHSAVRGWPMSTECKPGPKQYVDIWHHLVDWTNYSAVYAYIVTTAERLL